MGSQRNYLPRRSIHPSAVASDDWRNDRKFQLLWSPNEARPTTRATRILFIRDAVCRRSRRRRQMDESDVFRDMHAYRLTKQDSNWKCSGFLPISFISGANPSKERIKWCRGSLCQVKAHYLCGKYDTAVAVYLTSLLSLPPPIIIPVM